MKAWRVFNSDGHWIGSATTGSEGKELDALTAYAERTKVSLQALLESGAKVRLLGEAIEPGAEGRVRVLTGRRPPPEVKPVRPPGKLVHELKTDPGPFDAMAAGLKNFEIRKDDRGFRVGDELLLRRTSYSAIEILQGNPLEYTGATMRREITFICEGYGLRQGYVVLGVIEPI